jgi:sarcosine oxidase subunit beta
MSAAAGSTSAQCDAVIIGAGIQGLSTALHLALRGRKVIVVEKAGPGRHASGVNAGGVRSLWRDPAEIPLALASLEMWRDIAGLVGSDCGYHRNGSLRIAESKADMGVIEERVSALAKLGYAHEEALGQNALRTLVPDVSPHCVGGVVSREEGSASPYHATWAFYERAREAGVGFRIGGKVEHVERAGGAWRVHAGGVAVTGDALVNCAGAWGGAIAGMIGDDVPLSMEAPTMMVTQRVPPFLGPVCGLVARKLSFKQTSAGTVLIGGGHRGHVDVAAEVARPDLRKLAISARTVSDVFPLMRTVPIARSWCGIEGVTPDQLPVIGPSPAGEGAFHAFGFSAHGFALGPIVGRIMADLVTGGRTALPIAPFAAGRFARKAS